jgi:hypothetical protein
MQIDATQFVHSLIAPAGPAGDHPQQHHHSPDEVCLNSGQHSRAIEGMDKFMQIESANAVLQARVDLRNKTLESQTAFAEAAETLLTLGL